MSYVDLVLSSIYRSNGLSLLRVFRSLRAMRLIRSVGFLRKLRLIINALGKTLRNSVLNVTILMVLMMFIFAILGFYLFPGTNSFASISSGFFSLFRYVTAESWMTVQRDMTAAGYAGSEWFSIIFMFIINVVLSNLFIGVICENIDEATAADEQEQLDKKLKALNEKKKLLAEKQAEDMKKLFSHKKNQEIDTKEVDRLLQEMAGKLDENELAPMRHFYFHPTWLNSYLITLNNEMLLMLKSQQGHIRIINTIKEYQDFVNKNESIN